MKFNKIAIRIKYPFEGIIGVFLVFFALSCNETKEIDPNSLGYDFYPIEVGQYSVYDVEEIIYEISGFDTTIFQLREIIVDSIPSIDQVTYLIRRDKRNDSSRDWEADSVWTVTKTTNFLAINENNIPFIKLTFPVNQSASWNGNSLNSRNELTYYYQSLESSIIDSVGIDDHIRVIIEDIEQNIVNQDIRSEVYARGIGLVSKDYLTLNYCTAGCAELGEIESGRSLKQTLIEIGNE
ncbi:MAG: hypothetical protein AB8B73_06630 [Ekhidna sp.]